MKIHRVECRSGLFFICAGLFFSVYGSAHLTFGTSSQMGPGYFPVIVGILLTLVGAVIVIGALQLQNPLQRPVPWRGLGAITLGLVLFGLSIRTAGLVPATFVISSISALASIKAKVLPALSLGLALTLFCYIIFRLMLGLPLAPFGEWLVP